MDLYRYYEDKEKIDAENLINKNPNETRVFNNQVGIIHAMIDLIIENIHDKQSPPEMYEYIKFNGIKYIGWKIAQADTTLVWLTNEKTLLYHDKVRHRDYEFAEIYLEKISDMQEYSKQYSAGSTLQKSQMEKDGLDGVRVNPKKIIHWLIENATNLKIAGSPEWEMLISTID